MKAWGLDSRAGILLNADTLEVFIFLTWDPHTYLFEMDIHTVQPYSGQVLQSLTPKM